MLKGFKAAVVVSLVGVSGSVLAAPAFPDVAGSVDFSAVATQAGTVAIALGAVYVIFKGARLILGFLQR